MCQSLNLKPPTAGWQPEGNLHPLLLHIQLSHEHLPCFILKIHFYFYPKGRFFPPEMMVTELV